MRGFYSLLNCLGFILGIFIVSSFGCVFADDIEIDLGNSVKDAPKSKPESVEKKNLSNTKASSPDVSSSQGSNSSQEEVKQEMKSVVDRLKISSQDDSAQVSIDGENLPIPSVDKISNRKIRVQLKNTRLKIPSKINENNKIVKSIRSAVHAGHMAWIVLDVSDVKAWDVSRTKTGYLLTLNSNTGQEFSEKETISEKKIASNPSTLEVGNSTEKKLFSRLIDASFKPVEKGIKIVLTSDSPAKYTLRKLSQPEKLVIRFRDTKLEIVDKLKKFKNGDPELQKGGLLLMELRQIGPTFSPITEAILTLVPGTVHQIDHDLNQIVVTLSAPASAEKIVEKKGNLNQLVSMDIEAADLNAVVKTLASEANFDVDFVSGPLTGNVNEKFKDIPLKTALITLLAPGGYAYELQGNTLRIGAQATLIATKANFPHVTELISATGGMSLAQLDNLVRAILNPSNATKSTPDPVRNVLILNGTPSDVEDYKKAIKDLKLDSGSNGDRITRIVKLNYADPAVIMGILGAYLTPIGKVQPDGNRLVIWEAASNMGVLLELIKELDGKPRQVLIESNIVEVDDEKDLNLGISWSATKNVGDPTLNGSFNNLPVNSLGNPGSFGFGTIRSGFNISATLQALETHKKGKIISRPRIATASGVPAEIQTIENVIVATQTQIFSNGVLQTTTTFTSLGLPIDLKVTPRITDDDRITTIINASITSQTGPAAGAGAPPPTSVQTATTTITTKNGETIVIGGLVRDVLQDTINGIPLLSNLPIIGTLFQQHEKSNRKVELVIFITPTLLED